MTKPLNTVQTAAAIVAGVAWALLTLVLPVAGVPLAAAALATLVAGGRRWLAAATALAGIGATAVLSPSSVVYTAPALVLAGPVAVWALRRYRAVGVLVALAVVLFTAAVASDALALAQDGRSIVSEAKVAADRAAAIVGDAAMRAGDPSTARMVQAQLQTLSRTVFMLWPASYFEMAAVTALLALLAVTRVSQARGLEVNRLPRLSEVDVSVHVVWFVAAALLLVAASPLLADGSRIAVAVAGNVLLVARLPLLAQGLGVVSAALVKRGTGRTGSAVTYVAVALAEVTFYAVSMVGLADMWINFRRLPREQGGAAPGPAPG